MKELVLSKNRQYGDSVLDPKRYFSSAPTDEQIKVRIDDKINRLVLGNDSLDGYKYRCVINTSKGAETKRTNGAATVTFGS